VGATGQLTTTEPVIDGWMLQWYVNVPGELKVNE